VRAALALLLVMLGSVPAGGELRELSVSPITAYKQFCRVYRGECDIDHRQPEHVQATPELMTTLAFVTRTVNRRVRWQSDQEHWGVFDKWDMAEDGKGDCEDGQLLKRKILRGLGVPHRAMRMVVVTFWNKNTKAHEGHALLAVMTTSGPLFLDNLSDRVLTRAEAEKTYTFYYRESSHRPGGWVRL
jgi:predicted transglutaminase-like cysteine proteinase